jgi:acetyl esterase
VTLDDATAAFLGQMAQAGGKPMHEMSPEEARAMSRTLRDLAGPGPEVARVTDTVVPSPKGDIPIRVLVPAGEARSVIIYYHGGGWVIGAIDDFDTLGRQLAVRTTSTVVLVDYRLAPEHRYPAAAEDAYATLEWVGEHLGELAFEGAPLIVMGDSAGGNLSAVVAQRAREGGPDISLQVLIYPVTDANLDSVTYLDPDNQLMLNRDTMIWFWDQYAPDPVSREEPDASPARAKDLAGLPPAVVLTAEHDVLRSESEAYSEALRAAGVPVAHRCVAGQMHGFFTMVNILPGSVIGQDYVVEQVERHLTSTGGNHHVGS